MGVWSCKSVHCFPRAVVMVMILGLATVFIIALLRHDVSPYVPFISETGAYPPESGIFSLFLDLTATIGFSTIVLRYFIVEECNEHSNKFMSILNKVSLVIGIISMLGMTVVAAYPMVSIIAAHELGAMTLFVGSILYGLCQAVISYKMYPTYNSIWICHTRLTITILCVISFMTMVISGGPARSQWARGTHTHWTGKKMPDDEGFVLLVVSATAEWTLALLFVVYFLTFVKEFTKVSIHLNVRKLVAHFDDEIPSIRPDETSSLL